ncbi:MAG TPA: DNA-binding domain-containing protein [Paracoccaceae bacterium]|nr:DNA-binding domain-containing protein [Paracoccaceae bacterium]
MSRPVERAAVDAAPDRSVDAAGGQAAMAAALLDPDRPGPGDPRFAVHRNNVTVGLVEALGAAYPAVARLTGERFFAAAAREFVRARPPRSPVLIDWGHDFPDWLAAFPPAERLPWLSDVARLEAARRRAYHAAEAAPLAPDAVAATPPEALAALRPRLHPSLGLVRSRHPIVSIWADVTGPRRGGLDMSRAETALVVRPDAEVRVHAAPPALSAFVAALADGATLGGAAEAAAGTPGFDLGETVAALFRLGLLAAPDPASEDP